MNAALSVKYYSNKKALMTFKISKEELLEYDKGLRKKKTINS